MSAAAVKRGKIPVPLPVVADPKGGKMVKWRESEPKPEGTKQIRLADFKLCKVSNAASRKEQIHPPNHGELK